MSDPDLEDYWAKLSFRRALPRIGLPEGSELPLSELALLLSLSGERAAAVEAYREHLDREPHDLDALEKLAGLLGRLGRPDEQEALYRQIAALVSDKAGVPAEQRDAVIAFELATRGVAEAPPVVPPEFVARTFDVYSDTFEEELRGRLRYLGPEQIVERIRRVYGEGRGDLAACDLGCGTGVLGPLLRPYSRHLEGVDLSPKMVEKARAVRSREGDSPAYDALFVAEMCAHLDARTREGASPGGGPFHVITAADVLVYVGDLRASFRAVREALVVGGHFFCTVERADEDGFVLRHNGRYAHSAGYLREVAREARLEVVSLEEDVLRRERGSPVHSWTAVLARRS